MLRKIDEILIESDAKDFLRHYPILPPSMRKEEKEWLLYRIEEKGTDAQVFFLNNLPRWIEEVKEEIKKELENYGHPKRNKN